MAIDGQITLHATMKDDLYRLCVVWLFDSFYPKRTKSKINAEFCYAKLHNRRNFHR